MNNNNIMSQVTRSHRKCTCCICKGSILPKEVHFRVQSIDRTYCFKFCKDCLSAAVENVHNEAGIVEIARPAIESWLADVDLPQEA